MPLRLIRLKAVRIWSLIRFRCRVIWNPTRAAGDEEKESEMAVALRISQWLHLPVHGYTWLYRYIHFHPLFGTLFFTLFWDTFFEALFYLGHFLLGLFFWDTFWDIFFAENFGTLFGTLFWVSKELAPKRYLVI